MRLSNLVDASIFFLKLRAVLSLFARTWNMPQGLVGMAPPEALYHAAAPSQLGPQSFTRKEC